MGGYIPHSITLSPLGGTYQTSVHSIRVIWADWLIKTFRRDLEAILLKGKCNEEIARSYPELWDSNGQLQTELDMFYMLPQVKTAAGPLNADERANVLGKMTPDMRAMFTHVEGLVRPPKPSWFLWETYTSTLNMLAILAVMLTACWSLWPSYGKLTLKTEANWEQRR